jgi:hypothetical protein
MARPSRRLRRVSCRIPRCEPSSYVARRSGGAMNSGPTESLSVERTAAINANLIGVLRLQTASPRRAPVPIGFTTASLARGYRTSVNPRWRVKRRKMPRPLLRVHTLSSPKRRWLARPVQLNTSLSKGKRAELESDVGEFCNFFRTHCVSVHTADLESLKIVLLKQIACALDVYRIVPDGKHLSG